MLDSVGKLPDGMLENTKPFCATLGGTAVCRILPDYLGFRDILERFVLYSKNRILQAKRRDSQKTNNQ